MSPKRRKFSARKFQKFQNHFFSHNEPKSSKKQLSELPHRFSSRCTHLPGADGGPVFARGPAREAGALRQLRRRRLCKHCPADAAPERADEQPFYSADDE